MKLIFLPSEISYTIRTEKKVRRYCIAHFTSSDDFPFSMSACASARFS